ncbi:MAG: AI-2E family transporter, partial [Cytophagaceae bacterium]
TDAMQDAGTRISQYLLMQLVVNVSYGIPLAAGLWMIGVPGALLWGAIGAVMRFVPYIGPLVSAILPIALAFAVDDGWSMLLWTVALFALLELVSNNVVEPLLYGASTGLSAISLIAAAVIWTALWGPVGLMLSTPLTVCLLVLGRNLPQLRFLEVLLGSAPALDTSARIYQRLIADDVDEAIELANIEIEKSSVLAFYNAAGIETLRLANVEHRKYASADHRLRLASGMDLLLEELREQYPANVTVDGKTVVCIGGKTEIDTLAGEMVAHALALEGVAAVSKPTASVNANYIAKLDLEGTEIVCLSFFAQSAAIPARHACRRLKRRFPHIEIVLALWNAPLEVVADNALEKSESGAVVTSIEEAVYRIHRIVDPQKAKTVQSADTPSNDTERVNALRSTGVLRGDKREDLDALAKRAADVFNSSVAVISTIDSDSEYFIGQSGKLPHVVTDSTGLPLPMDRANAICNYVVANNATLVVPDIVRDPRFADNKTISEWNMRFYAGSPLRLADGSVIGALCILDPKPRKLKDDEVAVLAKMAADVVEIITSDKASPDGQGSSATIGQKVPD